MLRLTDEYIESHNNKKFWQICKKKFHYVDDSNAYSKDDIDGYYNNNDDSNDELFNVRKFHCEAARLDNVDDYRGYDDGGENVD